MKLLETNHKGISLKASNLILIIFITSFSLVFSAGCGGDPEVKYKELQERFSKFKAENKNNEARITMMSAIELKPKVAENYFELAEILLKLNKINEAVEQYKSALNENPDHRLSRLRLASIYALAREYELAESNLIKMLEVNPDDYEALVLQATIEHLGPRKNYNKAREILQKVLIKEPNNVAAIANLGDIEFAENNHKKAQEYYEKALAIDSTKSPLKLALADIYTKQGELDKGQKIIEKLLEDEPKNSEVRFLFAEFLMQRGKPEEAIKQYMETLQATPLKTVARDRLYDMYVVKGEPAKAKALGEELISKFPENPSTKYFLGRNLEIDGKFPEALEQYVKTISTVNNFAPAFRRAGMIEISTGKTREGLEHLNQAIVIDPSDVGARITLAKYNFGRRDYTTAKEHLNKVLQVYPRQLGANILRADIALVENDSKSAKQIYQLLIDNFPDNPEGYFKMGILEDKEKNYDAALANYRKALKFEQNIITPATRVAEITILKSGKGDLKLGINELEALKLTAKDPKVQADYDFVIGLFLLNDKPKLDDKQKPDLSVARKRFETVLEKNPNMFAAYMALAAIDETSGNINSAIQNYKNLIKINPSHIPSRMLLALIYEGQKAYEIAQEQYQKILETNPRFAPAANNLAWLYVEHLNKKLDDALQLATIAKQELPKESSVSDTLGWVYYKKGQAASALPHLQEAVELERAKLIKDAKEKINPEILFHLGTVQKELGNKEEASKVLEEAISAGGKDWPNLEKATKLLKDIRSQ